MSEKTHDFIIRAASPADVALILAFVRELAESLGAQPLDDWRIFRVTGEALARLAANR